MSATQPEKEYRVSALCTIYNAGRFIRGWLEDLEAQTIAEQMEIVLVDSNSPEGEREVVKEFQQRYDNIVYVRTPFRENSHEGFNRAAKLARGRYLTMANVDDRHKEDALERMAAVLDSRPDIALVYANSFITAGENETFDNHSAFKEYRWIDFDPLRLLDGCFMGPQPMWRRRLHESYGYFDEKLHSAADWDFWLRLAEKETFLHIDEYLGLYLFSMASSEHRNPKRHEEENALIRERYAHRKRKLGQRRKRAERSRPARSGTVILCVRQEETSESLASAIERLRNTTAHANDVSVRIVRSSDDTPEYALDVIVSPKTATVHQALDDAARWEAKYVVVISPDVPVDDGWLEGLVAAVETDDSVAAVGVIDTAPAAQLVASNLVASPENRDAFAAQRAGAYDGMVTEVEEAVPFCVLFRSSAIRKAGGLDAELPPVEAVWNLCRRLQSDGWTIVLDKDV